MSVCQLGRSFAICKKFLSDDRRLGCEPHGAATNPWSIAMIANDGAVTPLAFRPREAAKALGISPRHLWQLTKDGHIPCVRIGCGTRRTVLYPIDDLRAWLTRSSKA